MKAVLKVSQEVLTIENLYTVIIKGSAIFLGLLAIAMIGGIYTGAIH